MTIKMTAMKKVPGLYWYKDKNNEKKYAYRHRYYDGLGKRREVSKKNFNTEQEAHRALLAVLVQSHDGKFEEMINRNITVEEWLKIWLEANQFQWKEGTAYNREIAIRLHLVPTIGHFKLRKLTRELYQLHFINAKKQALAESSLAAVHSVFKIAVNAAVDAEILDRNRFNNINLDKKKESKRMLTTKEMKKIFDYVETCENETVQTLIRLLSTTGMRIGEALGLRWSDVNFEEKTIKIERTRKTRNKYVKEEITAPKSKNSYRVIDVDDSTIKVLNSYRVQCKKRHFYFGSSLKNDDLILVTMSTLRRYSVSAVSETFRRISDKTGVKATAHMFRHTVASCLLAEGKSVASVAALLGDTQKTIIRYYSHVIESEKKELTNVMSEFLESM